MHTHSVPTCRVVLFGKPDTNIAHLVLRVDESVIDAFGAVAEVEDGVNFLATIKRFGGSNFSHALP